MSESDRSAIRPDRAIVDPMQVSDIGTRGALVPTNGAEALEMAKLLSTGKFSVPGFLQANPGDCLRLVSIVMRTGLDLWMLADDAYLTTSKKSGETRMSLGAKSIHAIVKAAGALRGDLKLSYAGEGESLTCTVEGTTRSGTRHTDTYTMRTITTRNSPLWASQPRQQLGYYAERAWCRLHTPDALMGLVTREEAGMIDVTAESREIAEPRGVDKVRSVLNGDPAKAETLPPHDPDTGEVTDSPVSAPRERGGAEAGATDAKPPAAQSADELTQGMEPEHAAAAKAQAPSTSAQDEAATPAAQEVERVVDKDDYIDWQATAKLLRKALMDATARPEFEALVDANTTLMKQMHGPAPDVHGGLERLIAQRRADLRGGAKATAE